MYTHTTDLLLLSRPGALARTVLSYDATEYPKQSFDEGVSQVIEVTASAVFVFDNRAYPNQADPLGASNPLRGENF